MCYKNFLRHKTRLFKEHLKHIYSSRLISLQDLSEDRVYYNPASNTENTHYVLYKSFLPVRRRQTKGFRLCYFDLRPFAKLM